MIHRLMIRSLLLNCCGLLSVGMLDASELSHSTPAPQWKQYADSFIEVRASNGRLMSGYLDARTNHQRLWLYDGGPSLQIKSSLPWQEIQEVRLEGDWLTPSQLMDVSHELASESHQPWAIVFRWPELTVDHRGHCLGSVSTDQACLPDVAMNLQPSFSVTDLHSLSAHASFAQLNYNSERDGILLRLNGLNRHGQAVVLSGQLTVRLEGLVLSDDLRRQHRVTLDRWYRDLNQLDSQLEAIPLEMTRRFPQLDQRDRLSPIARVHVSLKVPGTGQFHAPPFKVRLPNGGMFEEIETLHEVPPLTRTIWP